MKRNRYRHTADLGTDLAGLAIALTLLAVVTLSSLYIYTWCRPRGPIAQACGISTSTVHGQTHCSITPSLQHSTSPVSP